ncbi:MAG TPA: nitrate ABC transporter substrate-binding protein [Rhodobiaceae bacterium]|nr:nitrate ABC transporter substrate-binding protein [Rhodobiaceae bacterium]
MNRFIKLSKKLGQLSLLSVFIFLISSQIENAIALEPVTFATDWKAQAEQGGFYQAKALGLYEKAGLNVVIRGGGPGINIPQLLGANAIDFAMGSNGFILLNMVQAGVPAKAVMAAFQKDPQVLITHDRDDINKISDMKDKPIMIADASINAFWVWMRARYGFSDKQIRKYTFNIAPFIVDKNAIQQGYATSEPFTISKNGVTPKVFLLSDEGYPSYAAMVIAQNKLIEEKPEIVQAFVTASIEGWRSYLMDDPTPGNQLILSSNQDMTQDILDQAINQIRDRGLVISGDALDKGIGTMTRQRWKSFFTLMAENGLYDMEMNWENAFTTKFVNKAHSK